jgi:hypothetical protein
MQVIDLHNRFSLLSELDLLRDQRALLIIHVRVGDLAGYNASVSC